VVASEVRSLALRSAQAAKEIKILIGTSTEKVEGGTRLVQDAGVAMNEIVSGVQRVTDIIGEISAAATEQSGGINQVNHAVTEIERMTQQNAALVEQSAAAAASMSEQAGRLAQAVATFRVQAEQPAPQPSARNPAPARQGAAPSAAGTNRKSAVRVAATVAPARPAATTDSDAEWAAF